MSKNRNRGQQPQQQSQPPQQPKQSAFTDQFLNLLILWAGVTRWTENYTTSYFRSYAEVTGKQLPELSEMPGKDEGSFTEQLENQLFLEVCKLSSRLTGEDFINLGTLFIALRNKEVEIVEGFILEVSEEKARIWNEIQELYLMSAEEILETYDPEFFSLYQEGKKLEEATEEQPA